jgi:AcrR family transcriptional regulator
MWSVPVPPDASPAHAAEADPARTDRRQRRRQQSIEEILDAAMAVMAEEGVAGLNLATVARRTGMRPPSLYQYFPSKLAIYDALFAQGNRQFLAAIAAIEPGPDPRTAFKLAARGFLDFCLADPARYQLLFQRTVPGFEPSAESYALAVQALEQWNSILRELGITDPGAMDISTAIVKGLVDQQLANDPGGDRWAGHLDEVIDMFLDHMAKRARTP